MKLLQEWSATDFDGALRYAAREGHIDCMKLAKTWGATDFKVALEKATYNNHLDCVKLLKEWINKRGER